MSKIKITNWCVVAELSNGNKVVVELPIEIEQNVENFISSFEQEMNDKVEQLMGG